MNDEFQTHLKKAGNEVFLSSAERERMKRTIHTYMEMKPLRGPAIEATVPDAWDIRRLFAPRPVAATLIVALFASTGGISYAAEGALPGDILYSVKTRVNEPVAGALAVSTSAKTAWAMNVAGTRIKEAATLAAQGRLDATTQEKLQASFEAHAQAASNAIAEEASSSPETSAETAVSFEAQLSEYEHVLTQVGTARDIGVGTLASSVGSARERVAAVRARAQTDIAASTARDGSVAVSRMRDAAKKQLDASAKLARKGGRALDASSVETVARELQSASTTISAGEDFLGNDAGPQALDAFQSALSAVEKLGVFLQTSSAIHERTGLIISEPGDPQSSSSGPRRTGTKRNGDTAKSEKGEEVNTETASSSRAQPESSASVTTSAAATTGTEESVSTSVQGDAESQVDRGSGTDGSGDGGGGRGQDAVQSVLPISVPVPIHL